MRVIKPQSLRQSRSESDKIVMTAEYRVKERQMRSGLALSRGHGGKLAQRLAPPSSPCLPIKPWLPWIHQLARTVQTRGGKLKLARLSPGLKAKNRISKTGKKTTFFW